MKKSNLLFLALAAALIGTSSPASAEPPANYTALKAGVYSPSGSHNLDALKYDNNTGFSGEIVAGHYFMPMLALELGAGYFESKGAAAADNGEMRLRVVPLIATGKVFLPLGQLEPYGLFGIGAYITDLDVHNNVEGTKGSTEVTYGLHAGAGVNFNFQQNMFVGAEGKYIWAEPSFGGQHLKLDGFITTAVLGFRY
jgi:opacity protein-like surface antigen